jgi:hypothetical protein
LFAGGPGRRGGGVAAPPGWEAAGAGAPFCGGCTAGGLLGEAGDFGCAGVGAAAGAAGCCGRSAAGGACGGGAAAGGAGRGGGAAGLGGGAGGFGAVGGGAALGGAGCAGGVPFGGSLGLPSSCSACATTSGAVCACDGGPASCIAVRAVVASSTRRSWVMVIGVPGKLLTIRFGDQRISVRPHCGGLHRRTCFISEDRESPCAPFIAHSGDHFKRYLHLVPPRLPVFVPAVRPACGPAVLRAAAIRRDPASAAAPRGVDFPAGFLAAAPTVVRA